LELFENNTRLQHPQIRNALVSLPSDLSFMSYDQALAHVTGAPLPLETELYWNQALLDVLVDYPIQSDQSRFSIHPGFAPLGLRVVTVIRFLPPGGASRAMEFIADPGLVQLDPSWYQAALTFVGLGFQHILGGIDHLLFLLCLVIPLRRIRPIILVVTAFTVAHSITLIASAYNLAPKTLWFPPLIETLIAMSIFYMALENIVVGSRDIVVRRRWTITFAFGLVHGFGFSFALRQTLQLAGSHLLASLLSFNVGIEIGQILVLLLVIPALRLLFRFVVAERMGIIILSVIVAHTAWHWMVDRGSRLGEFPWPALNAAFFAGVVRWLMLILICAGVVWLASKVLRRKIANWNAARERTAAIQASDEAAAEPAWDK
ncbi:MAG TPA: HupE/UreJ family protein, partial [Candidatus Angelobacter sp.]|nr:HupE/UreJ family protein [Candidatus Angelobacter sp.]